MYFFGKNDKRKMIMMMIMMVMMKTMVKLYRANYINNIEMFMKNHIE